MRLFESAGRHLSFKAAAEDLSVTPSAISHGVQTLEEWLGVELFVRGNRSLALTEAGAAYLPQVQAALEMLARASETVPGRRPTGRLAVSVPPTFGMRWLLPRLLRFNERYPRIEVTVDTSHRRVEFSRDGIDIAIRMGKGDWPGLHSTCLVHEKLIPVCAPHLAPSIRSAADLCRNTLLHVTKASEDWAEWGALAGVTIADAAGGLRFDTIQMALEAAVGGFGVALGRLPLIEQDLTANRLVQVLGPPRFCSTGYWMVMQRETVLRPEVKAFRNWINTELKSSSQEVANNAGPAALLRAFGRQRPLA
jgi:DNA-binding transcriptional LysR family regulator